MHLAGKRLRWCLVRQNQIFADKRCCAKSLNAPPKWAGGMGRNISCASMYSALAVRYAMRSDQISAKPGQTRRLRSSLLINSEREDLTTRSPECSQTQTVEFASCRTAKSRRADQSRRVTIETETSNECRSAHSLNPLFCMLTGSSRRPRLDLFAQSIH